MWHVTLFLYNFHVFEMYMFVTNVRHNSWWKTLKFWNVHHIICQCQCLLQSLGPLIVFVTCLMITFKIKRYDKCNLWRQSLNQLSYLYYYSWILCVPPLCLSQMFVTYFIIVQCPLVLFHILSKIEVIMFHPRS